MYRLLGTHVAPVPYWDSLDGCTDADDGCDRVVITDLATTSPDASPPRGLAPPATPHHPAARACTRRAADHGLRRKRPTLCSLHRRRLTSGVGLLRELPSLRWHHRKHGDDGACQSRTAELAGVRTGPAAQRCHQREHRHRRRQRRPPAPPADRAARNGGLLTDLPAWGRRRRRRARRGRSSRPRTATPWRSTPPAARILWTFTPPGYSSWAGSAQITNASPIADPDRPCVYAASPNGLIHKLSLADGSEDRSAGAGR